MEDSRSNLNQLHDKTLIRVNCHPHLDGNMTDQGKRGGFCFTAHGYKLLR